MITWLCVKSKRNLFRSKCRTREYNHVRDYIVVQGLYILTPRHVLDIFVLFSQVSVKRWVLVTLLIDLFGTWGLIWEIEVGDCGRVCTLCTAHTIYLSKLYSVCAGCPALGVRERNLVTALIDFWWNKCWKKNLSLPTAVSFDSRWCQETCWNFQFWVLSPVCKWATVRDGGLSAQWHLLPNWRQ